MSKWMLRQTTANIKELSRQAGISPVLAHILAVRGYKTVADIQSFLNEDIKLADPFLFADMDTAIKLTADAIKNKKKITVFGDYDADGIISTVILLTTLNSLNADANYYIPKRDEEGYGLNKDAILTLKEQGIEVIIACDNGISAFDEIDYAKSLGLEIIILDHHAVFIDDEDTQKQYLPQADAVVDAKRLDCHYPFKQYCAAGICYRFSQALYHYYDKNWEKLSQYFLPLVAIATVCDLVDLEKDNRYLVKKGLPLIQDSPNKGLQALLQATNLKDKTLDTYHIGFILGPCINASGRLDIADTAVELFMTDNATQAYSIANLLVQLNNQRKMLTEEGTNKALAIISAQKLENDKVFVIYCSDIMESVAGIIAGRIKEMYHHPVIVIAGDKDILRGSCRSIEGYNIFEGLKSCQEHLITFGGHPMAAGLTIAKENIDEFTQAINNSCELTTTDMDAIFRIDYQLPPSSVNLSLAKNLTLLAPYGKNNSKPLFADKNLLIKKITLMGKEEKVLRLLLRDNKGYLAEIVDFNNKDRLKAYIDSIGANCWDNLLSGHAPENIFIDIIYSVDINYYNAKESAKIQLIDFRPTNK